MIYPILYETNETDFFSLGLGPIKTATEAFVTEERNGSFILEGKVLVDDEIYPLLQENRIIKADASPTLTDQRFRIKRIVPNHEGQAEIYAEHVSYLSQELPMKPEVFVNGNGNSALLIWKSAILDDNPFFVDSDITTDSKTNWRIDKVENPRQALGGVEGSILDVWGGEYRFDNYHISLLKKRGTTANTILAYGRNITDFEQERNIMSTYTTVYPFAIYTDDKEEERIVTIDGYVVDCDNITDYPNRNVLPVDFSNEFEHDEVPTKAKLKQLAQDYIKNNDIGIPKTSIKVSFLDLAQTADYADIATLETVELCDDVRVHYEKLGVDTIAKVIRTKWNVLRGAYEEIEIGEKRTTLSSIINDTQTSIKEIENQTGSAIIAANGKNMIFHGLFGENGEGEPTAIRVGDMWYKPNGEDTEFYIWDGTVWAFIMSTAKFDEIDKKIEEAMQAGKDAEAAAEEAKEEAAAAKQAGENAANLATQAGLDAQAAKDKADAIKIDVNGLVSDVATINSTVSSISNKANEAYDMANAVEGRTATLETSVTGLTGRMTDIETTSTSTTKKLNELVVTVDGQKQTIATVTATADSALSKANVLESTVDGVKQTLTSVESTISNIGSSGTNLLINGGFENDLFGWGSSGNSSVHKIDTSEVHTGRKSLKIDAAGSVKIISLNVRIPVYQGQQLEFSLWYKTTDNFNGTSDNNKFRVGKQDGTLLTSYGFSGPFTEWTNRVATLTVGSGITELELRIDSNHSSGTVWWDDISIVDVTSKNQTNTKINQITDTVDGHTQLIASTKTTADSALTKATQVETTANGLKTTMSSVETTANTALTKATQVEQTADGLVSTVNRIDGGGTNLVSNGGFENDYVGWTQPTGFTITTNDSHSGSKSLAVSNTGSAGRAIGRRLNVPVVPGRKYEVSYWYKTTADANGVSGNQKLRIGQANGTLINALGWDGASTEWSQKSQIYTAGNNIFEWSITLTASHTVGTVWWDDISIVDVTDREATASQITQLSDTINLKVSKNDVVNQINLSTEGVLIAGNKIQIVGTTYIADAVIKSVNIADLAVTNGKIANLAVTEGKIGNAAITTAKIGDLSVSTAKIADGAIINAKIGNAAITNAKIADATISSAKIISIDANKIVANNLAAITANTGTLNVSGYLNILNQDTGMYGSYDYGDSLTGSYNPRWYTGSWRIGNNLFRHTADIFSLTTSGGKGTRQGYFETSYGSDYVAMRKYNTNTSMTMSARVDINSDRLQVSNSWNETSGVILSANGEMSASEVRSRGAAFLQSTLDVAGAAYLRSNVDISGGLITRSTADLQGSVITRSRFEFQGSLWLTGDSYINSMPTYNRTTSSAANLMVTSNGYFARSTSARKYKTEIEVASDVIAKAKKVLSIRPASWMDNAEIARGEVRHRYYGFIADEFDAAGLTEVVSYGDSGLVESLAYDRLSIYHNVILGEHEREIQTLKMENVRLLAQLSQLESRLDAVNVA